jgi:hypothetical protein
MQLLRLGQGLVDGGSLALVPGTAQTGYVIPGAAALGGGSEEKMICILKLPWAT